MLFLGIFSFTIDPIVIMDPLPILYPGPITDLAPIQTCESIIIGLLIKSKDDFLDTCCDDIIDHVGSSL